MRHCVLFLAMCCLTNVGLSEKYRQDLSDYNAFLGHVNREYPMQDGASLGPYGIQLGVGMLSATPKEDLFLFHNDFYGDGDAFRIPKVYLEKGLDYGINFGFSQGFMNSGRISQTNGHLQWTIFERFRFPMLAVRGAHSKLSGLRSSAIETSSLSAIAGYRFLRYFGIRVSQTWSEHRSIIHTEDEVRAFYLIQEPVYEYRDTWRDSSRGVGVLITVFPPFINLNIEYQESLDTENVAYAAKLTMGH